MVRSSKDAAAQVGASPSGSARNFASRLFGYDLFISFALGGPPRGSQSYASDLARRLRERDFTVFFSEDEVPPGEQLDGTLLKALHGSRLLVVIANRGTLEAPRWIRKEVEEFRRRHPDRPVIPINVGGALQDPALSGSTQEWLPFADKIWLDETTDAAAAGIVSPALIERLSTAPIRVRSNARWRRVVRGVVALLTLLAIALGVAAKVASDSAERARAELRRAVSLRLTGEAPAMVTGARTGGDEQSIQQALVAGTLVGASAEVQSALLSTLKAAPQLSKVVNTGVAVGAMTFSDDGTRLVVAGTGTLQLWDAKTLQPIGEAIRTKQSGISSLAVSADGKVIVSGSEDGTLAFWSPSSAELPAEPVKAHKNAESAWAALGVQAVVISPDGARIASSGWDWTLKLWDAKTGKQDGDPLIEQEGYVSSGLAFNADGSRLVAAGNDPELRLWDVKTRRLLATLDIGDILKGDDDVASIAFSPQRSDGAAIVAGTKRHGVWILDAKTGKRHMLEGIPPGAVSKVAFTSDGRRILAATEEGAVHVWNLATGKSADALAAGAKDSQTQVAFAMDGRRIGSGDSDGRVRVFDISGQSSMLGVLHPGNKAGRALVFGTGGGLLALRNDDATVELRATQSGALIRALSKQTAEDDNLVALSRDGARMVSTSKPVGDEPRNGRPRRRASEPASLSSGARMRLWNTQTGKPIGAPIVAERRRYFNGAVFTLDGARFASYEQEGDTPGDDAPVDGRLQIWDANTGKPIGKPLEGHKGGVRHAAFSPDGTRLVSAGVDGTVRLWDAERGVQLNVPSMTHEHVALVTFAADGKQIASGADTGTIRVWNTYLGSAGDAPASLPARPGLSLKFSDAQLWSLAFGMDGTHLVAAGSDGVRMWDARNGRLIGNLPLPPSEGPVFEMAFNSDGALMGHTAAGAVVQWPAVEKWADLLCSKLTRNMSHRRWSEVVSTEIAYQVQCASLPVPEE